MYHYTAESPLLLKDAVSFQVRKAHTASCGHFILQGLKKKKKIENNWKYGIQYLLHWLVAENSSNSLMYFISEKKRIYSGVDKSMPEKKTITIVCYN